MIYVTFGIRQNTLLVHTKTALHLVAAEVFTKRGQPAPMTMVEVFMRALEAVGGLQSVAAFFFDEPGDCVFLEQDEKVHGFYATEAGVVERGALN